jgi:CRISP-associated protein Cas1
MQLILNTFGASLRKKDDMFLVRSGERQALISPRKVQSIVLAAGVHLSTDAIRLALLHNIDIALLDKHGEPYGRFWHARLGSTNGCGAGCSRSPRPRTGSSWPASG